MATNIPCIDMAFSTDVFAMMELEPRSSLPETVTGRPVVTRARSGTTHQRRQTEGPTQLDVQARASTARPASALAKGNTGSRAEQSDDLGRA
ncbi:uncharacterized protein SCHCODRAFT_02687221 [Schizophyllum commune H4-8]|nr:uncharacterized protein SCHCODRAFT_02687221 [Schizophyllum commune H4-8]KAI5893088.1 hypothetical protein SCHCODRAFT_02687221 [Schizophyllum commune H4-8]